MSTETSNVCGHSSRRKSRDFCSECNEIHAASELMMRGKRNMFCNMIQEATDSFAKACEIFAKHFGEEGDQMAIPYLNYGKALLEMGKIENGILGHAVKQSKDLLSGETSDDKAEEKNDFIADDTEVINEAEMKEQVWNSMSSDNMYAPQQPTVTVLDPIPGCEHAHEDDDASQDGDMSQDEEVGEETADDHMNEEEDAEPEEESNLQHAWNILEIAAKILRRNGEPASLKLAETKMALGHVSMETETYEKAIEDFSEALQLMRNYMENDDRRVAEAMYNVGLAYSFINNFNESIVFFKDSRSVLERRIGNLESRIKKQKAEEFGKSQPSNELEEMENEHKELSDIVMFDMASKLQEVETAIHTFSTAMKTHRGSSFCQESPFDASSYDSATGTFVDSNQISVKRKSSAVASDDIEQQKRVAHAQDEVMRDQSETRCEA